MSKLKSCAYALLGGVLLSGFAPPGHASDPTFVGENKDFVEEEWKESALALPPFPADADLIEFYVGPTETSLFFIDSASLSIGDDGVVRYTLVTRTAGGARNVIHEGIRCANKEKRLYAIGRPDNTWSPARNSAWTRIGGGGGRVSPVHTQLLKVYFCVSGAKVTKPEDAIALLKRGGYRAGDDF